MKLSNIAKAVFAGAIAALGGLEVASVDNRFTAAELIRTAIIGLGALTATYWVPNAPADPAPADVPGGTTSTGTDWHYPVTQQVDLQGELSRQQAQAEFQRRQQVE